MSVVLYKLTDQNWETYNYTKWGPGVTHQTNGRGEMCGPGWLHAYMSPELAVLLNPIHANISKPVLWKCEGIIQINDLGLKVGTTKLTTIKQLPLPIYTTTQRVIFSLLCVLEIYKEPTFILWAQQYIDGTNRSAAAARAVEKTARAAAEAAARAVEKTARAAAEAAARAARAARAAGAAEAATWAARAAWVAEAAWAAQAATWAARVARVASQAAQAAAPLDLQKLALKALSYS